MMARYDYSTLGAYKSVDKCNDGYITPQNIEIFLRTFAYLAKKEELDAIVRRIDTDGDGKLAYQEFAEFIKTRTKRIPRALQ